MGKRKSGTFRRGEDVRGFPEGTPFFAEGFLEGPVKLVRDLQDKRLLVIVETMFASSHADYLTRRYHEKGHAVTYDEGVRLATALTWLSTPYDRRPGGRPENGVPYLHDYELLAGQEMDSGLTVALVERSETEKLAWDALQQGIQWRRQNQEPVTGALLEWALDVAEGTRERPRRGREQTGRDLLRRQQLTGIVTRESATFAWIRRVHRRNAAGKTRLDGGLLKRCHFGL